MANIALQDGKVVLKDGKASCTCCDGEICISGSEFKRGPDIPDRNVTDPCTDFLTVTTTQATKSGLYKCTGVVDDQGSMTWASGSYYSPGSSPNIGPCFGRHSFEFNATLNVGDTVSCEAGSWGSDYGCQITCCYVSAP